MTSQNAQHLVVLGISVQIFDSDVSVSDGDIYLVVFEADLSP
jgi:hypothetical protein